MTRTKTLISYEKRVIAFWIMAASCLALLFVYIFSINATAHNIAEKQRFERENAQIKSELDSLEFAYVELKNEITIELAQNYGFTEAKNTLYVPRTPSSSLSLGASGR